MATQNEEKVQSTDKVYMFTDTIKFKVSYPKDFKKTKHIKEGQVVEMHVLQAEDWKARGLGEIVK